VPWPGSIQATQRSATKEPQPGVIVISPSSRRVVSTLRGSAPADAELPGWLSNARHLLAGQEFTCLDPLTQDSRHSAVGRHRFPRHKIMLDRSHTPPELGISRSDKLCQAALACRSARRRSWSATRTPLPWPTWPGRQKRTSRPGGTDGDPATPAVHRPPRSGRSLERPLRHDPFHGLAGYLSDHSQQHQAAGMLPCPPRCRRAPVPLRYPAILVGGGNVASPGTPRVRLAGQQALIDRAGDLVVVIDAAIAEIYPQRSLL
jgi:hypothetical protein